MSNEELGASVDRLEHPLRPSVRTTYFKRHAGGKHPFWRGVLSGLTSVGCLYPGKMKPVHYPHSCKDDLFAIGGDMWTAFEKEENASANRS